MAKSSADILPILTDVAPLPVAGEKGTRAGNVSFTADSATRERFGEIVSGILGALEADNKPLSDEETRNLVARLGAYCSKRGWQNTQTIEQLQALSATLKDALIANPGAMQEAGIPIQRLIGWHNQETTTQTNRLRREKAVTMDADTPRTPIATYGEYTLEELHTPDHLQAQSLAIFGCCVGTDYNKDILLEKGLKETDPEAKQYLTYALKMRGNDPIRIFSLSHNNVPIVTIEYNVKSHVVTQIKKVLLGTITGEENYFRPLCELLYQLGQTTPIETITGLPPYEKNRMVTRSGIVPLDPASMEGLLQARVEVDNTTDPKTLQQLAATPRITLDVTELSDLSRLPAEVNARLISNAKNFSAPLLQKARDIHASNTLSFEAPLLRAARDIDVSTATSFKAPRLQKVRDIYTGHAGPRIFEISELQTARDLVVGFVPRFVAPRLDSARKIDADCASYISAPELCVLEGINASSAIQIDLPKLCKVKKVSGSPDIRKLLARNQQQDAENKERGR